MDNRETGSKILEDALYNCSGNVCILDSSGQIVYVNKKWKQFADDNGALGKTWLGANYLDICDASEKAGDPYAGVVRNSLNSILNQGSSGFMLEYPCPSPCEKRWFQIRAEPITQSNELFVCIYHEQFVADTELLTSQSRLELALDSGKLGIWEYQLDKSTLIWNHWMYIIYGLNPSEAIPSYELWQECIHPDDHATVREGFWAAVASHGSRETEFRVVRPDGEVRHLLGTAQKVVDQNNTPIKVIGINIDITEQVRKEEEVRKLAFFDQVTGIPNRTSLKDALSKQINSAAESHFYSALLFMDIDNFKKINDSEGHWAGDEFLRNVVAKLNSILSQSCFVSRYGGDEFVILMRNVAESEDNANSVVKQTADKILKLFHEPFSLSGREFICTVSIGITLFNGAQRSMDDLLKEADMAMYHAKKTDRGTIGFFNKQMQQELNRSLNIETALNAAILNSAICIKLQPQVFNQEGIVGAEVLARWTDKEMGVIAPNEFIPIAEETGQIVRLGEFVFDKACGYISSQLQGNKHRALKIGINISVRQFHQNNFVDFILATLAKHSVDPRQICLEITETMLLQQREATIKKMHSLREHGIQFSIDDFGTGYCSLSYLKDLPINQLKIDKAFIDELASGDSGISVVKSIIALGASLNMHVIAEGVETVEQKNILESLGCQAYQGYLFSKPLELEDFTNLIRQCDPSASGCNPPCSACTSYTIDK